MVETVGAPTVDAELRPLTFLQTLPLCYFSLISMGEISAVSTEKSTLAPFLIQTPNMSNLLILSLSLTALNHFMEIWSVAGWATEI